MYPYFAMMLTSSAAAYYAAASKEKNRAYSLLFSALCIASVVFLAAVRDPGVGTDTLVYGQWLYDSSLSWDIVSYLEYQVPRRGFPMALSVYIVNNLFQHIAFQYAFLQLIAFAPLYYVFYKVLGEKVWIAVLVYCSYFFSVSLNFMNQSIAMSICLLGWYLASEKRFIASILVMALAISFHATSVVFAPVLLYEYLSMRPGSSDLLKKNRPVVVVCTALVVVMFLLFVKYNLDWLAGLKESYAYQVKNAGSAARLPYSWVAWILVLTGCFSLSWTHMHARQIEDSVFLDAVFFCFIGALLYTAFLISPQLYRLSLYYLLFTTIGIPRSIELLPRGHGRCVYSVVIIGATIACCTYMLVSGAQGTYPYASAILGIG